MKKLLYFILLFSLKGYTQLAVNIILPPGGFMQKQQLWNILVTNPSTSTNNIRIEMVLTEISTGQPVLSATTGPIMIPTGTKQLSATNIGPVQYTITSSNYRIDPGPAGLLPVGFFNACYTFFTDGGKTVAQDCQQLNIQPLSPLLLNLPSNSSVLDNGYPTFGWIPFSSAQFFTNLTYAMKLVEVYPGQSAADATERNSPLYTARNLTVTNLFYGPSLPVIEKKKQYAWQITAVNNVTEITKSEAWSFNMGENPENGLRKSDPVYAKLKKESEGGSFSMFYGNIRFEYFNETSDTTWNVILTDISTNKSRKIHLSALDSLKMQRGENLINIPGKTIQGLQDKHIYLLHVSNSRKEIWQLKFEYRREEE